MARRAAVYLRISKDDLGTGLGIERQRQSVKSLADAKGWRIDPAWVIEDANVSASKKKPRPEFERLLRGMQSGEVEAVLAYAMDRLVRRLDDLTRLIDIAEEHGIPVSTVAGDIDLSTGHGRGLAKMLGVVASIETDNMSERHRAQRRQSRQKGSMRGGGLRPYGFTDNRAETVPEEALVIREVAERIIGGESPTVLFRDLNKREVPKGYGGTWTLRALLRTLQRPALCGRVTYKGALVRDDKGQPVRGEWTPILSEEEYDDLQVALGARRRIPSANWGTKRKHLLSGIARCGICTAKMIGVKSSGKMAYQCAAQRHLSRLKDPVDAFVIAQVQERAEAMMFPIRAWEDDAGQKVRHQIVELEERKHRAVEEFADDSIPSDVFRALVNRLEDKIVALRETQVVERIGLFKADWLVLDQGVLPDLPVEGQRATISLYVQKIVVHPAPRGRKFDPSLVEIVWRDTETFPLIGRVVTD